MLVVKGWRDERREPPPPEAEALPQARTVFEKCWAEARIKIARMTLTIKLDGNWSSFQLANSAPPLSVTDSAIAPSARMAVMGDQQSLYLKYYIYKCKFRLTHWNAGITHASLNTEQLGQQDSM